MENIIIDFFAQPKRISATSALLYFFIVSECLKNNSDRCELSDSVIGEKLEITRTTIYRCKKEIASCKLLSIEQSKIGVKSTYVMFQKWNMDVSKMEHGVAKMEHGVAKMEHGVAKMEHGVAKMEHGRFKNGTWKLPKFCQKRRFLHHVAKMEHGTQKNDTTIIYTTTIESTSIGSTERDRECERKREIFAGENLGAENRSSGVGSETGIEAKNENAQKRTIQRKKTERSSTTSTEQEKANSESGNGLKTKAKTPKAIYKFNIDDIPHELRSISDFVDAFSEFVEHRRLKRKPIMEHQVKFLINNALEHHKNGFDVVFDIRNCIANGYQGIFYKTITKQNGSNTRSNSRTVTGAEQSESRAKLLAKLAVNPIFG